MNNCDYTMWHRATGAGWSDQVPVGLSVRVTRMPKRLGMVVPGGYIRDIASGSVYGSPSGWAGTVLKQSADGWREIQYLDPVTGKWESLEHWRRRLGAR